MVTIISMNGLPIYLGNSVSGIRGFCLMHNVFLSCLVKNIMNRIIVEHT